MEEKRANDPVVRRVERLSLLLLAAGVLGGWAGFGLNEALGVLLGGLIAISSFQVLKWQLHKTLGNPARTPRKGRLFFSYYLRFIVTLVLVFLVIYFGWANPVFFLVGFSVIVISVMAVGGFEFAGMLTKKGDN
ncbi:MAG: ATP synthase subunit I [Deltaproteobacteria bacterium]|nr:ATP synthase subunit I [Deltaproteobacteria bacterium]